MNPHAVRTSLGWKESRPHRAIRQPDSPALSEHPVRHMFIILVTVVLVAGCGGDKGGQVTGADPSGDPAGCSHEFDFEQDLADWEVQNWLRSQGDSYHGSSHLTTPDQPISYEAHCGEWIYSYPRRSLQMVHGVDMSECSAGTVEFWHRLRMQSVSAIIGYGCHWDEGSPQWCTVELSANGGPWVTLKSYGYDPATISTWTKESIVIDEYVGPGSTDLRVAFRISQGTSQWNNCHWDIDLLSVHGQ